MFFKEVIGQSEVKQRLLKSAKENRVSHALLFLGAEGSGNLPLAISFAQYLVCEAPLPPEGGVSNAHTRREELSEGQLPPSGGGGADSCGVCPACIKMNKLVHPDVTFSYPVATSEDVKKNPRSVDFVQQWRKAILENPYLNFNDWIIEIEIEKKQGIISVDESADILHRLSLKSAEGSYKIVIIWLPEKMNASAANKLLKIIEEPPDQTLFFLVAENYEQIIPTILSRTQLIKVNAINDKDMVEAVMSRHTLSKEAAVKIAHRSGGNYHEALNLIHHQEEDENMNQQFLSWMRCCLKLNLQQLNEIIDEFSGVGREKQKLFLQNGLHVLRECLMINYADHSMIRFEGEELESFKKFAPFVNSHNSEKFVEEFNKAHFHIERNAHFKILFTDLSFTVNRLLHEKAS